MSNLFFIFFFLLLPSFGEAQTGPRITFEYNVCDRGEVPYMGDGKFKFPFQNTGDSPLIISKVNSSCGCLVPYWPKEPVEPGQWDTIYGKYDTKRLGPINKSLTVYTNDSTQKFTVLKIKGEVFQEVVDEVDFFVEGELLTLEKHNRANFNKTEKNSITLSIVNKTDDPQSILVEMGRYRAESEKPFTKEYVLQPKEEIKLTAPRYKYFSGEYRSIEIYVTHKGKHNRTVWIGEEK